jgi:hypothetical protein
LAIAEFGNSGRIWRLRLDVAIQAERKNLAAALKDDLHYRIEILHFVQDDASS